MQIILIKNKFLIANIIKSIACKIAKSDFTSNKPTTMPTIKSLLNNPQKNNEKNKHNISVNLL